MRIRSSWGWSCCLLAVPWLVAGCGGGMRHAKIPRGTDAEIVCSAWLDQFLEDPGGVPMAPSVEIKYLGVGEDTDPFHATPPGLIASGDPSFDVAEAGKRNIHCQGVHRLDAGDGATALWTKTFRVALDLAWDGQRFEATEATIILDSARNESIETMFERNLTGQTPVQGRFTGGESESFYGNVAVYQGVLPGEVASTGSIMYAEYSEIIILGMDGHLRYHEPLHVRPEVHVGDDVFHEAARGTFAQATGSVTAEAMDMGLERTAVMFSWDESRALEIPVSEGTCPVTETWRTSAIKVLGGDPWKEIFERRVEQHQSCDCAGGCDIPGREFEGYSVELEFKHFVSAPTIIDVIITYDAGGFEHERWEYGGKKYALKKDQ